MSDRSTNARTAGPRHGRPDRRPGHYAGRQLSGFPRAGCVGRRADAPHSHFTPAPVERLELIGDRGFDQPVPDLADRRVGNAGGAGMRTGIGDHLRLARLVADMRTLGLDARGGVHIAEAALEELDQRPRPPRSTPARTSISRSCRLRDRSLLAWRPPLAGRRAAVQLDFGARAPLTARLRNGPAHPGEAVALPSWRDQQADTGNTAC